MALGATHSISCKCSARKIDVAVSFYLFTGGLIDHIRDIWLTST